MHINKCSAANHKYKMLLNKSNESVKNWTPESPAWFTGFFLISILPVNQCFHFFSSIVYPASKIAPGDFCLLVFTSLCGLLFCWIWQPQWLSGHFTNDGFDFHSQVVLMTIVGRKPHFYNITLFGLYFMVLAGVRPRIVF
jgi:hypothetical protein